MAPTRCGEGYDSTDAEVSCDDGTNRLTQLRRVIEKRDQDRCQCDPGKASKMPRPAYDGAHECSATAKFGRIVTVEKPRKDALFAKIGMRGSNGISLFPRRRTTMACCSPLTMSADRPDDA